MKRIALIFSVAAAALSVSAQTPPPGATPLEAAAPKGEKARAIPVKSGGDSIRFISDFDSPPFSFMQGRVKKGMEVDFGEAIAKELGKKAEWTRMPFDIDAFAEALDSGRADVAIASITITPAREGKLAFTKPYFLTSLAVATRRDAEWKTGALGGGLAGWEVGVLAGSTAETWAARNLAAKLAPYPTVEEMGKALDKAKFSDKFCILLDKPILNGVLGPKGYRFRIVEENIDPQTYGIAVKKGNDEMLSELNSALEKIDKSDLDERIYRKWNVGEAISADRRRKAADLPLGKRRKLPGQF